MSAGGASGTGRVPDRSAAGTTPGLAGLTAGTSARVGLARTGTSMTTADLLAFQADHAQAREAVHADFEADRLMAEFDAAGVRTVPVSTRSGDRGHYLRHPEAGRRLSGSAREQLSAEAVDSPDVVLILSDGLSATAANRHGVGFIVDLRRQLLAANLLVAPVVIAPFARVGLLNDVGAAVGAAVAAIVLGERPGLSAPDGLSLYAEYAPRSGLTDADRNCISNIRPGGLPLAVGADRAAELVRTMVAQRTSGVGLTVEYAERSVADGSGLGSEGLDGLRRDLPEAPRLEVLEGLDDLPLGRHNERPVLEDRLAQRDTPDDEDLHLG